MKFKNMTPNFSVEDVAKTIEFYQNSLGFSLKMLRRMDMDTIEFSLVEFEEYSYGIVSRDNVHIMFVQEEVFKENIPVAEADIKQASVLFYIDLEGVDELYDDFKKKDIEFVKEMNTTWYGRREFYVKDCNGYILAFGEHL